MKKIFFFVFSISVLVSMTQQQNAGKIFDKTKPAIIHEYVQVPYGYQFHYKTDDSERIESGTLDETKGDTGTIVVRGYYQYVGSDGKSYEVQYTADEDGFKPLVNVEDSSSEPPKSTTRPSNITDEFIVPVISSAAIGSLVGGGLG